MSAAAPRATTARKTWVSTLRAAAPLALAAAVGEEPSLEPSAPLLSAVGLTGLEAPVPIAELRVTVTIVTGVVVAAGPETITVVSTGGPLIEDESDAALEVVPMEAGELVEAVEAIESVESVETVEAVEAVETAETVKDEIMGVEEKELADVVEAGPEAPDEADGAAAVLSP